MSTDLCVYTIKHSDDLRATLGAGGSDTYREGKVWARAKRLLGEATRAGKRLPVIFAPAEATRYLFAWALLDEVVPDTESAYTFSGLQLFEPRPQTTTLKKASNGKPLDRLFIRPYAICRTPDYLWDLAGRLTGDSPFREKTRRQRRNAKRGGGHSVANLRLRPIPAHWLERRVDPEGPEFEQLRAYFGVQWQAGDEVWHYDEPAPPGVLAGELGIVLVRSGQPVHAIVLGIH
jgi:hypothetical protein